jgi:hypothetical protein
VVDADLKSYFDTIPKDRLLALVASKGLSGNSRIALIQSTGHDSRPGSVAVVCWNG